MEFIRRTILTVLCGALAGVSVGCEGDDVYEGADMAPTDQATITTGQEQAAPYAAQPLPGETVRMSPAEIFGIVTSLNRAEIEAARFAGENATQFEVRDFAFQIQEDHHRALQNELDLANRMGTSPSMAARAGRELAERAEAHMAALRNTRGDDVGRTYVDGQIQMHEHASRLIRNELLPSAQGNRELVAHLTELHATVLNHLGTLRFLERQLPPPGAQPAMAPETMRPGARPTGMQPSGIEPSRPARAPEEEPRQPRQPMTP